MMFEVVVFVLSALGLIAAGKEFLHCDCNLGGSGAHMAARSAP